MESVFQGQGLSDCLLLKSWELRIPSRFCLKTVTRNQIILCEEKFWLVLPIPIHIIFNWLDDCIFIIAIVDAVNLCI